MRVNDYENRYYKSGKWWQYDHGEYFGAVSIMLDSEKDNTVHEEFEHDAKCSMCYLGYPHTKAVHDRRIK